MSEEPRPTTRKAQCAECGGMRNCDIHGSKEVVYADEHISAVTTWYLLECRGCETVFVETVATNSEDYIQQYVPGGNGETEIILDETIRYWPALSKRQKPEWMADLAIDEDTTDELKTALDEVYGALDADLRMLAAIGIRTAFDVASELLQINAALPFTKKLDALVSSGRIGAVDKDRLGTLVDAGSASAHRGWRPKPGDLATMMDVLEHFVFEAFVAPARRAKLNADAAAMKTKVPPRKPKPPKVSAKK